MYWLMVMQETGQRALPSLIHNAQPPRCIFRGLTRRGCFAPPQD